LEDYGIHNRVENVFPPGPFNHKLHRLNLFWIQELR
jgi:hypothetical protein